MLTGLCLLIDIRVARIHVSASACMCAWGYIISVCRRQIVTVWEVKLFPSVNLAGSQPTFTVKLAESCARIRHGPKAARKSRLALSCSSSIVLRTHTTLP